MKYYKLLSGTDYLGKAFTFEARHYYMSKLSFKEQRYVLWEAITLYDQQPEEKDIIELNDLKLDEPTKGVH